jgi:NAD(P)-dependent dehydrogenase (short-subunit alcohol dehydrogenase family)
MIDLGLDGKACLITGAGRGVGRETALRFASQGCRVAILARTLPQLEEVAEEVKRTGMPVLPLRADASKPAQVRDAVARAVKTFGTVDILVNNAAVNIRKPLIEYRDEEWRQIIDTNLTGYFLFCREAGKYMTRNRRGTVVNVGSELGVVGDVIGQVPYSTSKGGVNQLTRCLAAEWGQFGINVNCVAPTLMDTQFTAEQFRNAEGIRAFIERVPLGRLPQPAEVADIILFLSSRFAAAITGQVLLVDGGYTIL